MTVKPLVVIHKLARAIAYLYTKITKVFLYAMHDINWPWKMSWILCNISCSWSDPEVTGNLTIW